MPIGLRVLSPEKQILGMPDCKSVTIPAEDGQLTILAKHAPFVVSLGKGEVVARSVEGKIERLAVGGGFATITGETVTLLVDYGADSADLNEAEIVKAKARAEEILKEKADAKATAMAQANLTRALSELKIVRRKRKN